MIDLIYKTLLTIINKENQGYVSPTEFNLIANNVQNEIFRSYFEDENRDSVRENKGYVNKGYANLAFNERQRIIQFSSKTNISKVNGEFILPNDLYLIEDDGVLSDSGKIIQEVEKGSIGYLLNSSASPSSIFPVYEQYVDRLDVYPSTIDSLTLRYVRMPKKPTWTYFITGTGGQLYDPSNSSFQDFELHVSEFSNIVNRMLTYFGINLREQEIVQIAETLKDKLNLKDNS